MNLWHKVALRRMLTGVAILTTWISLACAPRARATDILLIEDQDGFGGAAAILAADGHAVTVVNFEWTNGYANLLNGPFLSGFDFVVYGERGNGFGEVLPATVAASLENYIQGGGNLLVTGYDTLGSPTDNDLASLVRVISPSDYVSGDPDWTTANVNNFILNGPYGDFRNLSFTATGYDDDYFAPDAGAGAIELATIDGQNIPRIVFTPLPGGGSVGYWNGGYAGVGNNAQPDFSDGGIPQGIFRNWAAGVAPVPEPASLLLSVGGAMALLARRRGQRAAGFSPAEA